MSEEPGDPGPEPGATTTVAKQPTAAPATSPPAPKPAPAGVGAITNYLVPQRIPPRSARVPLPAGLLPATVAAGVSAAILLPVDRPGLGWLLAGLVSAGLVYTVDRGARRGLVTPASGDGGKPVDPAVKTGSGAAGPRRWPHRPGTARIGWSVLALSLLAMGALRAAPWLFVLCVIAAGVAGSMAVVRRSAYGVFFDALAVPYAATTVLPWLYRATRTPRRGSGAALRMGWSLAVTAGLLMVLVPLLAGADAVFAGLVDGLTPRVDAEAGWRWAIVFTIAGLGVAGALYLLAGPPPGAVKHPTPEDETPADANHHGGERKPGSAAGPVLSGRGARRLTTVEWGIPVAAMIVVFTAFVATQLAVLFGGDDYVQRTAGLTYAEYARSGFWQLSIVSVLTLAVIATVLRFARVRTAAERRLLRGAVATVSVSALVIVASALHRMWTYQQAYGFTVLRLLVEVFEIWIAVVYLLVLASLVRLERGWVPRATVGAAALTLLVLAIADPERLVAECNIDRWQAGATLDTHYLSTLSADILPAADRLPDPQRALVADVIRARLGTDSWQGWNYSRATARR